MNDKHRRVVQDIKTSGKVEGPKATKLEEDYDRNIINEA